jgi:hypothetical protein
MEWQCWQLRHCGEGPRGEMVTVFCENSPAAAAEQAAEYFDDCEQRATGYDDQAFDGNVHHIEVVGCDFKATRHEVVCEVMRRYKAVVR